MPDCNLRGAALRGWGFRAARAARSVTKSLGVMAAATTEYLLDRELDAILYALTPGNRLVARAQLETGLRVSDVLGLQFWQLRPQFWITERKTGKRRHIGMSAQLIDEIRAEAAERIPARALRDARARKVGAPVCWAFPGRDWRKHRTRQAVWRDIRRVARAYKIPVTAGTHSMRKIYAVRLRDKYGDIDRVRRALNHDDVSITLLYAMADLRLTAKARGGRRIGGAKRKSEAG